MEIFWYILGALVLVLAIAGVTILVGRRRGLPPSVPAQQITPGAEVEAPSATGAA